MSKLTLPVGLLAGSALLFSLACGTGKPAPSRVIANIGGEKLTEAEFQDVVRTLSQGSKEAETFLTDPAARQERAQLASRVAMARAITTYAKKTGLDKDPSVQRQLEQGQANIYFQALAKQRSTALIPSDEQLQAFYKEQVDRMKSQGMTQPPPPFESVKTQLTEGWKQQRMQEVSLGIQKDIKALVPITLADDYRPAGE